MREMTKEDAIREYGHRYSPSLEDLNLVLDHGRKLTPEEALIKKLNALARNKGDGVEKFVEELGTPQESFHFKDLEDVNQHTETAERKSYRDIVREIGRLVIEADSSGAPQSDKL